VAMMAERGIVVSHTTIHRWVIRYVPEFEKRSNRFARPVNTSWRLDETYIKIRGQFSYLYRAVDKHGKTVDFLLRPDRGIAAAQAFFRKALSTSLPRWPRKITLDGHLQNHLALRLLRREDPKWKYVEVRSNQYLNNLIEQDHRAIKPRCAAMVGGFKSFGGAAITLAGIELAHRIRKRQQAKRFLERIEETDKNWKFSSSDIHERKYWKHYVQAYEQCLAATSAHHAPWYAVPADDKENARLIVSQILIDVLDNLKMAYPRITPKRQRELRLIGKQLGKSE
jgi:transposase-like protein